MVCVVSRDESRFADVWLPTLAVPDGGRLAMPGSSEIEGVGGGGATLFWRGGGGREEQRGLNRPFFWCGGGFGDDTAPATERVFFRNSPEKEFLRFFPTCGGTRK